MCRNYFFIIIFFLFVRLCNCNKIYIYLKAFHTSLPGEKGPQVDLICILHHCLPCSCGRLCWGRMTYLCEDAELLQGTLGGHGGGAGKAGRRRGVGCRGGGGGGTVALLDQVWEVMDAASKAVPVRVLRGGVMVGVVVVRGAGGVEDESMRRRRAGARREACEQAKVLRLARRRGRALSVVTCTLEVERGVDNCGSMRVPDQLRGRERVRWSKGRATAAILQVERKLWLVVYLWLVLLIPGAT